MQSNSIKVKMAPGLIPVRCTV